MSVVGFVLTIWQLSRTASAARATAKAIQRAEQRMTINHLLVLLPQFQLIERDLDTAAEDGDRKLTIRALVAFSHIAHEVAALLSSEIDADLAVRLASSARTASKAKADLVTNPKRDPAVTTKAFREEFGELSAHLGGLAGRFRVETGQ